MDRHLDILDEPRVIGARKYIIENRLWLAGSSAGWSVQTAESADIVGRSFDAVSSMIRKGLLPEDYILDSRSVEIGRLWDLLSRRAIDVRTTYDDSLFWGDFEGLAKSADAYLRTHDIRP